MRYCVKEANSEYAALTKQSLKDNKKPTAEADNNSEDDDDIFPNVDETKLNRTYHFKKEDASDILKLKNYKLTDLLKHNN